MHVIRRSDYAQMRWKNGAGSSLEIAASRVPAGGFIWRLSMADIEQPGPFSSYDGYERVTALVAGAGFTLRAAGAAELQFNAIGDCHAYAGSVPYSCELRDGPSRDLNLIARSGLGASMSVLALASGYTLIKERSADAFVLPLNGRVRVLAGNRRVQLAACDALCLAAGEAATVSAVDGPDAGRPPTFIAVARVPPVG
jgi:environmental stress-induced protein Ves